MIRASVEDHERRMKSWRGWLDYFLSIPLLVLLLPFVIGNAVWEKAHERSRRRAVGACVKCGHVHKGTLLLARDAHGWDNEVKLCRGSR